MFRHRSAQSRTAQALREPMLYKQQQRISTAGGIMENPAYGQPHLTKLNGNTEVADKSAVTRISDADRSTSTDNLLMS